MANILIIDDDAQICDALQSVMLKEGHDAWAVHTLADGRARVQQHDFDCVFLDVQLPDGNGLQIIPELQSAPSSPDIIIITGQGHPDGAELAIKNGAWHYIEKPLSLNKITLPLQRVLQYRSEKKMHEPRLLNLDGIIGSSPLMKKSFEIVARAAATHWPVLLTGETGTGKELFARAIHENSNRSNKNFVVLDCTALPEKLVESILFGHEKGAFTGADTAHDGLFLQADGGTLFLDEVGDLPFDTQKTFLRVLQERRFRPVGSRVERESNFRVIAATNRDLGELVQSGRFRSDLMYRLASLTMELPPLRERREDIVDTVMHYTQKTARRLQTKPKLFSGDFMEALMAYDWPGNVRELVNAVNSSLAAAGPSSVLYAQHLPESMRIKLARLPFEKNDTEMEPSSASAVQPVKHTLGSYKKEAIRQYLTELLPLVRQDVRKACQLAGVSRSRLYALLQEYKIK